MMIMLNTLIELTFYILVGTKMGHFRDILSIQSLSMVETRRNTTEA